MNGFKGIAIAGLFGAALASGTAGAGVYSVTVSEGLSNGNGFNTANGNPYGGANSASATFTFTGALDFSDTAGQNSNSSGDLNTAFGFSASNISNYLGTGSVIEGSTTVADFSSLASYLASSGSASGYQYGSYYTFDLGVITAGTMLTITHDDGISLFQGGTEIGSPVSGPTSQTTDEITVTSTGDTILRYSRQNGTPSILEVSSSAPAPEPGSFVLFGTALGGLGLAFRRRAKGTL